MGEIHKEVNAPIQEKASINIHDPLLAFVNTVFIKMRQSSDFETSVHFFWPQLFLAKKLLMTFILVATTRLEDSKMN